MCAFKLTTYIATFPPALFAITTFPGVALQLSHVKAGLAAVLPALLSKNTLGLFRGRRESQCLKADLHVSGALSAVKIRARTVLQ